MLGDYACSKRHCKKPNNVSQKSAASMFSYPEDNGSRFHRNVYKFLSQYKATHPRRHWYLLEEKVRPGELRPSTGD
jgi:hypothetical protein